MDIIVPTSLRILSLPLAVIGVDPDSTRTAYALLVRSPDEVGFRVAEIDGGGASRKPVAWGDVTGALVLVSRWRDRVADLAAGGRLVVVVEAQHATGGPWAGDVEGCRRARWHWDAACHQLAVQCVHVAPTVWEPSHGPDGRRLGPGEVKREYRRAASAIDARASNEDRAAALGIAAYWIQQQGGEVVSTLTERSE